MAAHDSKKNILTFGSFEEFKKQERLINRNTPIYIDSNLGNGIKGEDIAGDLHKLGFTELFLATGYSPETIDGSTSITGQSGLFQQAHLIDDHSDQSSELLN